MSELTAIFNKALLLASLIPRRPVEFYDRVRTVVEVKVNALFMREAEYEPLDLGMFVKGIESALGVQVAMYLLEPRLARLETEVISRCEIGLSRRPFTIIHNADFSLARLCYALCRAVRPRTVLETGVAYGVTSAFILDALDANGEGLLHSVDLPPLGRDADHFVGSLIPAPLKNRWRLHRGVSRRVLPELLPQLLCVDIFIHDSLHTYWSVSGELRTVSPHLAPAAIVLADDVEGNRAFLEWALQARPQFWAIARETGKESLFGGAVFSPSAPGTALPSHTKRLDSSVDADHG